MGEKETLSTAGGGDVAVGEQGVPRPAGQSEPMANDEAGAQRASNLNLSKSNIDRLVGAEPESEAATNLNSSKSNTYRAVGGEAGPEETTVKSGKSNSSDRWEDPGSGEPAGAPESSNRESSESNT